MMQKVKKMGDNNRHVDSILLLLVGLGLIWTAVLIQAAPQPPSKNEASLVCRIGFKLPKIFDFATYKAKFHKVYTGLLDELTRQKYFMSRVIRALISAVKYRYRKLPHYLSVNLLSDASPAELERRRNKALEEYSRTHGPILRSAVNKAKAPSPSRGGQQSDELPKVTALDPDEARSSIRRLIMEHGSEPGFRELKEEITAGSCEKDRKKRDTAEQPMRELPLSKLVNTGEGITLAPEVMRKINANSTGLPAEFGKETLLMSSHTASPLVEQQNVREIVITAAAEVWQQLDPFGHISAKSADPRPEDPMDIDSGNDQPTNILPDEVFVDLRATNCFFLPREQGACGSCYAFATVAMMEWLYCMRFGQLVPFSEQYLVDCGKGRVEGITGCQGGTPSGAAKFVHNFGLELRAVYPYVMREDQCPHEERVDLRTTGFMRSQLEDLVALHIALWPLHLPTGPLWAGISLAEGFSEYGGGVHGWGCDQQTGTHAVVVIGHGREDGHEYWLMRNSHSIGWGEGGYYKLAKAANCVHPEVGYKFGHTEGDNLSVVPTPNSLYEASRVRQRYAKNSLTNYYNAKWTK